MLKFLKILPLFLFGLMNAQEEVVHSVYFEFDKFNLKAKQLSDVVAFVKTVDSTRIESIEIFGYCDDRGKDAYNVKLSQNRANTIQQEFIKNGIKNKVIVTIEGKGRVLIDDDVVENLPEVRSKNRRVDVVLNFKPLPKIQIPGYFHNTISKNPTVGDRIYLDNLLFDRGSSVLTLKSKKELDRMAKLLLKHKNVEFEIQGHVCCTPNFQKEAIDRHTRKRKLSHNRAEAVFKYLKLKKIPEKRMTFKGYGNTVPLGKGPEYDRRVELLITKV
ncbi:outer membrane protein OmpA-like peptidoglycan-associated protein [Flavobacterium arsenatis]|uniref:Outer membrane protein OmpA-like peptidoglycan-associated protein n=1 Tax=Flavobacterium arsenatis TaxID=1484332 RepID=A0ABU1TTH6_9FLAO|nr:OmpA family protein [Flavobacterium arsenatis]MDR6969166.1 outer membrane protein OmpA-like peptidoglycan-associated protein [Flavobacterium arsenatis]